MLHRLFTISFLFVISISCVTSGSLDSTGFKNDNLNYAVTFKDAAQKSLLGPAWTLDNGFRSSFTTSTRDYAGRSHSLMAPVYDLRFTHKLSHGVISVRSAPLSEEDAQKKLPILGKDIAEAFKGDFLRLYFGTNDQQVSRLVSTILESKAIQFQGEEAFEELVEVADVDQIKLNPQNRLLKFKAILVRPAAPKGWTFQAKGQTTATSPGILIITYSMDHAYYEEYLPEFDDFVSRISLK